MSMINLSGLDSKSSRLKVASKLLGKPVTSFTDLNEDEVSKLAFAFKAWNRVQIERHDNGSALKEACAIWDMMSDNTRLVLNERGILPDKKTRKEISMSKEEVDKSLEELKKKYSPESAKDAVSKVKLESNDAPAVISGGRWDSWRLIKSPSVAMGLSIGIGGIPRGKVMQLWGKNHAGKSMMAQLISAQAVKQGLPVYYFDTESSIEGDFAMNLGLDVNNELFNLKRPKTMEELATDLRALAGSGAVVVVDSIAASESEKEFNRQLDKKAAMVGGNSAIIKSTLNIIRPSLVESATTLIIINQARKDFDAGLFGDPDKAYGPEALFHNTDIMYKVDAATEQEAKLKDKGYLNTIFHPRKNRLGEKVKFRLSFKPGFEYNKSLDLLRVCGGVMGKDSVGRPVTYYEAAGEPIVTNYVTEIPGSRDIEPRQSRYTVKVDGLMLAAILKNEPDFDVTPFTDEGIQPDTEGIEEFIANGSYGDEDTYNGEDAVWGWFSLPGRGEASAFNWMQQHPIAREVLVDRLYNSLNHKHELLRE